MCEAGEKKSLLVELLPHTFQRMQKQLISDEERWGETWRHRTLYNQDHRMAARLQDYLDQFKNAQVPLPYEKIACLAHIALVRIHRTDLLLTGEQNEPA